MCAIENDAPMPQFKSLNCTLWYNTHARCATRRVRLLVAVLSKPCAIIVFGIVGSMKMLGYINTVQNIIFFVSTHFITFCGVLFCCMPRSFSGKRRLLTCMQHTRTLTRVQHTKHYSHAAHEK